MQKNIFLLSFLVCFSLSCDSSNSKKIIIITEYPDNNLAQAIIKLAHNYNNIMAELITLSDYNIPFMESEVPPALKPVAHEEVVRLSDKIATADAIIFVIANYHNGYSGLVKNAMDSLWQPWHDKPVAIIGYSDSIVHGEPFMNAFKQTLLALQTDPIETTLYIPHLSEVLDENNSITSIAVHNKARYVLTQLFSASESRRYLKKIFRKCVDSAKRKILKAKYNYFSDDKFEN